MKKIFINLTILFISYLVCAQSEHFPLQPEESQLTKKEQVIGIDTIRLEYSKPNLMGRKLFGEMLPWGAVWRTGANASTKIEVSEEMFLNGNTIPKGKYSILSIPGKKEWTIIINKNIKLWGHYGYKKEEDLLRFTVKPTKNQVYNESFNIVFNNTTKFKASIEILWGEIKIPLKIEVNKEKVDKRIMTSINEKLNDPEAHIKPIISAHVYFMAADYYYLTNRDLKQALKWMDKAIEVKNVNYFHYYHAQIFGKMKKYDMAIKASEKGLAMFEKGNNEEWKWRYRSQIEKWKKEAK